MRRELPGDDAEAGSTPGRSVIGLEGRDTGTRRALPVSRSIPPHPDSFDSTIPPMKTTLAPVRFRALTTLLVGLGFAMLMVSGGVLLISPPGRIANWTQWAILGLTKRGWTDLHVVFGALFLVAGLVHLAFNWRPLLQHLGARMSGARGFRSEMDAIAAAVAVAVFFWHPGPSGADLDAAGVERTGQRRLGTRRRSGTDSARRTPEYRRTGEASRRRHGRGTAAAAGRG